MMNTIKRLYIIIFSCISSFGYAQKILTIEEAVNIAMKNNYNILVAWNEADIAKANNTPGNAGMLPSVNISSSGNYESNNVYQEQSSGEITEYNPLTSTSLNAGAQLTWTLYDGGKMFVTKQKLSEIQALGEIKFRESVVQTLFDVYATYYDIVKQKHQLAFINEVINLNQERVIIAQTGFDAGTMAKTDLLQAKIDLNVALENAINQEYVIITTKNELKVLLGVTPEDDFDVSDSIPFADIPDRDDIIQKIDSTNTRILAYKKQLEITGLSLKEANRLFYPKIDLRAGYYYMQTNNSDGSVLQNSYTGPQIGGTITIPLFNGNETRRKVQIAQLEMESAKYDLQNILLQVDKELENALTEFENQKKLMEIEKENNELARENFEISLQRMKLGQTNTLEVHQAQENFVQSSTRLFNFEYNLKLAELKLKQLLASF
ncbi:MAG: TolC family protein [Bacteroidales bacterium]|nr:TolC family protein [Bacteroidales bacterium]